MKRLGIPLKITIVFGLTMGFILGEFILDYRVFFVTTEGLQWILAIPAIVIGLIAGWQCWIPIVIFLSTSSLILYARALGGRDFNLYYLIFAFGFSVLPIWKYAFHTFLTAYIAALCRALCFEVYYKIIKHRYPMSTGSNEDSSQGSS